MFAVACHSLATGAPRPSTEVAEPGLAAAVDDLRAILAASFPSQELAELGVLLLAVTGGVRVGWRQAVAASSVAGLAVGSMVRTGEVAAGRIAAVGLAG